MKQQKWFKKKYYLILRNVENLQEKRILQINIWQLFFYFLLAVLLPLLFSVSLGLFIVPYFKDTFVSDKTQWQRRLLNLAALTDSLRVQSVQHEAYIETLQAVFSQDVAYLKAATPPSSGGVAALFTADSVSATRPIAKDFLLDRSLVLRHLYPPLNGFVSDFFSLANAHYGVDIVAPEASTIQAVADGHVLFAAWSEQEGYVIAMQHAGAVVSIYKHNAELFKRTGEKIYAGEPVAIIGNTGTHSTGPHLHFELWHQGVPINPSNFIIFY